MAKQTETRSRAENETSLMLLGYETKNQVISGGKIDNFEKGWAIPIFSFGKAHYFRKTNITVSLGPPSVKMSASISLCGLIHHPDALFGAGNFPKCKRCEKALKHG
jgi:hypothetical protein